MLALLVSSMRAAGFPVGIEELKDILWLAERFSAESDADVPVRNALIPKASQGAHEPTRHSGVEPASDGMSRTLKSQPGTSSDGETAPLFSSQMAGTISASIMRVQGVASSEHAEDLRRALQPFAKRKPSRWRSVIDEDESATRAANTGVWYPVYVPIRERWFELSVIIESSSSMALWNETLADLLRLLRNQGGFRAVAQFALQEDGLLNAQSTRGPRIVPWSRLGEPDRPRLVLFISDATSPNWHNGTIRSVLRSLSKSANVTVMQVLPRRAWRHTMLGEPDITLFADRPGEINSRMKAVLPWWLAESDIRGRMKLPVIGLDSDTIRQWARTMTAGGRTTVPGVLTSRPRQATAEVAESAETSPRRTPAERIANYRAMVSRGAYDLAVFLSVPDPLTVPVMRLVQRAMLPTTGVAELAEFFAGNLLEKIRASRTDAQGSTEASYRFVPGVREELTRSLRYSEEGAINAQLRSVGRYLVSHTDQDRGTFAAYFPTPQGKQRLTDWSLPFASVSRAALTPEIADNMVPPKASVTAEIAEQRASGEQRAGISLQISFSPAEERVRFHLYSHTVLAVDVEMNSGEIAHLGTPARLEPYQLQRIADRLVPPEIQDGLGKASGNLTVLADDSLQAVPWELLLHEGRGGKPAALVKPLLRLIATTATPQLKAVRPPPVVWVVGDPALNKPQLPSAQEEAREVASVLQLLARSHVVKTYIRGSSGKLSTELLGSPYRAILIAGHTSRDKALGVATDDGSIGAQEILSHNHPPNSSLCRGAT